MKVSELVRHPQDNMKTDVVECPECWGTGLACVSPEHDPDGSGGRLNIDWKGLLRLHELIHDRIALEGCVCETCSTRGCHRPATWEIECRGVGVSGRLIYSCDEHCPDPAILSPQDEMRRLVEK